MTAHSVLNVRAAPKWGNSELYKYYERNGLGYGTVQIAESEDDGPCCQESSSQEGANPFGAELSQEDDEGLFIPSYLEEALPDDPVLQVKMACAM